MKKVICFFVIIATLTLVSCNENMPRPEKKTEPYAASMMHASVELASRVLLVKTGGIWYYSKADGESYPFCFNPLCRHTFQEKCTMIYFNHTNCLTSQVVYCEENDRVYIGRGQKIYSMSFDASDVRLECSLGENGDLSEMTYNTDLIRNLRCKDKYLYFIYNNDLTGNEQVIRYDIETKKLKEMTSATDENIIAYEIADNYIYFRMVRSNNESGYFVSDLDFNNKKLDNNPITPVLGGMTMDVYDGEYFYGKDNKVGYYKHNPITGEKTLISEDSIITNSAMILAVHDGYVYFSPFAKNEAYSTYYNSVYRISDDGKIEKVFDMPEMEIFSLNFVSDGVIINYAHIYINGTKRDDSTQKFQGFLHLSLDENGKFVNSIAIGEFSNDEDLITYLAGK